MPVCGIRRNRICETVRPRAARDAGARPTGAAECPDAARGFPFDTPGAGFPRSAPNRRSGISVRHGMPADGGKGNFET